MPHQKQTIQISDNSERSVRECGFAGIFVVVIFDIIIIIAVAIAAVVVVSVPIAWSFALAN